jgi:hypothetical protein
MKGLKLILSSVPMYKKRLSQWKMDAKNNKTRHMQFIVLKKAQRDALGKATKFQVRGRPLATGEIERYTRRHRQYNGQYATADSIVSVDTPSSVGYGTPCSPNTEDNAAESADLPVSDEFTRKTGYLAPLVLKQALPCWEVWSPEASGHAEYLFRDIHSYVQACFSLKVWVSRDTESVDLLRPVPMLPTFESSQYTPSTFYEHCLSAITSMKRGEFVTAGAQLRTASAMVRQLLTAEDPRMLQVFLNAFILFKQEGYGEIADQFVRHIVAMVPHCDAVLDGTTAQTPLRRLWQSLEQCYLSSADHGQVLPSRDGSKASRLLLAAWQCTIDANREQLGDIHGAVVSSEMELIGRQTEAGVIDLRDVEGRLGSYLQACKDMGQPTGTTARRLLLALGFNLYEQGQYARATEAAMELILQSSFPLFQGPESYLSDAFGHELLALCYEAGADLVKAASVMTCALELMAGHHGRADPWVTRALERVRAWQHDAQLSNSTGSARTCVACTSISSGQLLAF